MDRFLYQISVHNTATEIIQTRRHLGVTSNTGGG